MRDFLRFLDNYFKDPDWYTGFVTIVVALIFTMGGIHSLEISEQFEPVHFIYGFAALSLTLTAGYYLIRCFRR